ncbi:hypothetical protein F1717_05675 [Micrococcus luteus]|uniref:hypothetical protein n=1 Tax=Micrococcus luteus TaxID=1270 RepID=UPI0013037A8F|nr:hypothetical protein [Micrococcus luteus]QGY83312.1 hypothetical protein F1717_05675 [Micrococcus luteus]
MVDAVANVGVVVLLVNLLVALVVVLRRDRQRGWLLVTLLGGTCGAGLVALAGLVWWRAEPRAMDVALVLIGLAAVSVVARHGAAAPVRGRRPVREDAP